MKLKQYPKYKDSGVQWIGEIPEGWSIHKIKYLLKTPVTDGPHETPEFLDEGIPFLSVDSIQNGEIIFENTRFISYDIRNIVYRENGDWKIPNPNWEVVHT